MKQNSVNIQNLDRSRPILGNKEIRAFRMLRPYGFITWDAPYYIYVRNKSEGDLEEQIARVGRTNKIERTGSEDKEV